MIKALICEHAVSARSQILRRGFSMRRGIQHATCQMPCNMRRSMRSQILDQFDTPSKWQKYAPGYSGTGHFLAEARTAPSMYRAPEPLKGASRGSTVISVRLETPFGRLVRPSCALVSMNGPSTALASRTGSTRPPTFSTCRWLSGIARAPTGSMGVTSHL